MSILGDEISCYPDDLLEPEELIEPVDPLEPVDSHEKVESNGEIESVNDETDGHNPPAVEYRPTPARPFPG